MNSPSPINALIEHYVSTRNAEDLSSVLRSYTTASTVNQDRCCAQHSPSITIEAPLECEVALVGTHGIQHVQATVYGDWAVHERRDLILHGQDDGYRVSHVPTGMTIASVVDGLDFDTACRVAVALDRDVPSFSRPSDVGAFRSIAHAAIARALEGNP